jgi:DNA polymerase elongation subunit (family B)
MKPSILFIDIETVSQTNDYNGLSERIKTQWARKSSFIKSDTECSPEELYHDRAAIYAEFGKIVTIGLGYFDESDNENTSLRLTSIANHDESQLLADFITLLAKFDHDKLQLCGHNGKEFDFPYLCRRLLVNGFELPYVLDTSGKKPWEVNHLDTMEMWKFGDWKHYTSLELLAAIFDIESSKDSIDGSQVGKVYYDENDLDKIAKYCMRDVAVTAQLYLKLKSQEVILPEHIIYV